MVGERQNHRPRQRFLLRLFCARFSYVFASYPGTFSRIIVEGVDGFLRKIFWGSYRDINQGIAFIFDDLKECSDEDLWKKIFQHRHRYQIAIVILIRTLLYFKNYETSSKNFISRVNSVVGKENFLFDRKKFDLLFIALYSDLFQRFKNKSWAREMDLLFGEEMMQRVRSVHREFSEFLSPDEEPAGEIGFAKESAPPKPPKTKALAKNKLKIKRILAVDDDEDVRNVVADTLSFEGYQVETASSMEKAEWYLDQGNLNPDLIIIDIFMPGKGGIKGIEFVRQNYPDVKIMAISGGWGQTTPEKSVDAAAKSGADAVVQKPFHISELVRQVRQLIEPETIV